MPDSSTKSTPDGRPGNPGLAGWLLSRVRSARVQRAFRWFAAAFALFGLLGYLAGPPLLRAVLGEQLAKAFNREVRLGGVEINPYALSVTLTDLSVLQPQGGEMLGIDTLHLNLSSFSVFQAGVVVDAVRLHGLRLAVRRTGEGKYDISDLLDEWLKPSTGPMPRFSLNNIEVRGASLQFDDEPRRQVHRVDEINLAIPFISSLPYQAEIVVQPHFSARIDGSQFEVQGRLLPFSPSHESEIAFDLDQFDLARLAPYLPAALPVRLRSGHLDTKLNVVFSQQAQTGASLVVQGALTLSGLQLSDAAGVPVLALETLHLPVDGGNLIAGQLQLGELAVVSPQLTLSVDKQGIASWQALARVQGGGAASQPEKPFAWSVAGIRLDKGKVVWRDASGEQPVAGVVQDIGAKVGALDSTMKPVPVRHLAFGLDFGEALRIGKVELTEIEVDPGQHFVGIGHFALEAGRLALLRDAAGRVQWLAAPQLKPDGRADGAAKPAPAWRVGLKKLEVSDVLARFEDRALAVPARQQIALNRLTAQDVGNDKKAGRLDIDMSINGSGGVKLGGEVGLQPLMADLAVEARTLSLLPLQPYFAQYLNASLARGQVSAKGVLRVRAEAEGLKGGYTGSLTLGDMLLVDKANSADFLKWKSLFLAGMDVRLNPLSLNIGEVALSDFYSRLIVNPEGSLNLTQIFRKRDAAPVAAKAPAPATPDEPLPLSIGKVSLQGGAVEFTDRFVKPNFSVSLGRLGGRITGLSSRPGSLADMELRGSYANTAPVQITGRLNPLTAEQALDVQAEIRGVDLVGFSPYSGKYAGYDIEKGKLSLFLNYKLQGGKLEADNRVFLDQLTFGNKVESPTATSLPVNLAIALLKNGRGEIDINLPISGSLSDPQFSLGGVIVKVVVNLFVKAVTSPFALLGSMFGAGEELSFIEFGAGQATLAPASLRRLEGLAKALNDRSGLRLEIGGHVDPDADREGIKRVALERAVRAEKLKDQIRKGQEGASVDAVRLTVAEYPVFLKKAYGEARFPKPRNLVGLEKDLPVEEMEKLMLANLAAGSEELRLLAQQRALVAQSWLIEQGKIAPERIFLTPPRLDGREAKGEPEKKTPMRADFSLR